MPRKLRSAIITTLCALLITGTATAATKATTKTSKKPAQTQSATKTTTPVESMICELGFKDTYKAGEVDTENAFLCRYQNRFYFVESDDGVNQLVKDLKKGISRVTKANFGGSKMVILELR